jgi:NDP-sugar pyrophosphorylase family protein
MKAIILAGGYATRLMPLTLRLPKLLLPVAGKPLVHYCLDMLKEAGVDEVVFSLNVTQKIVQEAIGSEYNGMSVSFIFEETQTEGEKLGAIGAMQYVAERTSVDEDCLLIGSDNFVYGLDLKKMVEEHRSRKPHATIALFDLLDEKDVEHFGVALLEGKRITRFQEKPSVSEAVSKLASTAIYHVSPEFFKRVPAFVTEKKAQGLKADRPGDLWAHLVEKGEQIEGFVFKGVWGDIGNPATYIQTNKMAMALLPPQEQVDHPCDFIVAGEKMVVSKSARIGSGAVLKAPVIIEDNAVIGENSVIGPYTHVMKDVRVGAASTVSGSILFEGSVIEDKCLVHDSIIDRESVIAEGVTIAENSLVGEECVIGEGSRLLPNTRVWPKLKLDKGSSLQGTIRA